MGQQEPFDYCVIFGVCSFYYAFVIAYIKNLLFFTTEGALLFLTTALNIFPSSTVASHQFSDLEAAVALTLYQPPGRLILHPFFVELSLPPSISPSVRRSTVRNIGRLRQRSFLVGVDRAGGV